MLSVVRTLAFVAACTIANTACSSDDGDDDGDEGSGGGSNGGSSNGGSSNGGSGGGSGDCTEIGCPDDEMCTVCLGANGELVNACISEGVACY
jgi:hypothetical protein